MRDLTPERLTRLLSMITYFSDGRAVPFSEAADHFGITEAQLLKDLNTLWVSGAPGYTHSDLIDFEASAFEDGMVQLREAQNMDRPLRLAPVEAVALLVALDSLIARLGPQPLLLSTQTKLREAAGKASRAADAVRIKRTPQATLSIRQDLHTAISEQRQVWLRYVSGTDKESERHIDPLSLFLSDEHWVVGAWCHQAQAHRRFRLDRILSYDVLDLATVHKPQPDFPDFDPSGLTQRATLWLMPQAKWVVEQMPVDTVIENPQHIQVEISAGDSDWLVQLCLRLGESLLAIYPQEISDRVRQRAQAALNHYQE